MKGDPVKIMLCKNVVPYCTPTARRIPFPILPMVKKELQHLEEDDIIKKSHQTNGLVLTHCSSKKKNRDVRICMDLKKLNSAEKGNISCNQIWRIFHLN